MKVAPNGHPNCPKRPLMDKGVKFIVGACRSLFGFAAGRRHLPPYADNPFSALQADRMPVEDARPVVLFTTAQERDFLASCDGWQFPLFLTLMLTGLRPGELAHLLLPEDLDLEAGLLRVRNRPRLGWQVKTRSEREVPLVPSLVGVLRESLAGRRSGPVFRRRRFAEQGDGPTAAGMERDLAARVAGREGETGRALSRIERQRLARAVWRDAGAVKPEEVRLEFIELTARIGLPGSTAPKLLRHQFATALQDAGVDPLIRNELMGHAAAGGKGGGGLGMTAVYTHTRPETKRRQLEAAMAARSGIAEALARRLSAHVPADGDR